MTEHFLHGFRARSFGAAGFAAVAACSFAVSARADGTPSANDVAMARSLGTEGVQLADAGNCVAAIDRLERAEALYHAPTILGRLGECEIAVGKIVVGTEALQRVVREQLSPTAPAAFVAAHVRAQKVLDAALPKIGKLRIHVANGAVSGLAVKVDGASISSAALDADLPADPGAHRLEASAPGFTEVHSDVTLGEGTTAAVTLMLVAQPGAGPVAASVPSGAGPAALPDSAAPAAPAAPVTPSPEPASKGPNHTAAYVLLGAGGAGIVVGSIFGVLALGKKSTLESACHPKSDCPSSSQNDIDSMNGFATVSTVGFIVGGLAAATGGILLFTGHGNSETAGGTRTGSRIAVHPWIGPTSAGVMGAF